MTTVLVGLGSAFLCNSIAQQHVLDDSARITDQLSTLVIGPLVPGYLAKDPAGVEALDRVVDRRTADGTLVKVAIWSADGSLVYSDKAEDIGKRLPPSEELSAAIAGRTTSNWEDDPPEADGSSVVDALTPATDGRGPRRFVEVYAPLRVPGQPPLAFEVYYNYRPVDDLAGTLLRQLLPLVLIPLVLLQLIQIPVGLSLGRRLRRSEDERMALVQRDLSESDRERVRFATALHDGPIQELAGGSYALGAVAATAAERQLPLVSRVQDVMHHSIQNLRGLMTDIDRPDLRSGRLDHTIASLAERLRAEGIDVELELAELPDLGHDVMATLYRVVREALISAHTSGAGQIAITLAVRSNVKRGDAPRVLLTVVDDGAGLDPGRIDRNSEGYLRMQLLHDRVASLHGELAVSSCPGGGTTVRVDLPAAGGVRQRVLL